LVISTVLATDLFKLTKASTVPTSRLFYLIEVGAGASSLSYFSICRNQRQSQRKSF